MKPCPSCGSANDDGARFCASCGATLAIACAQCGASLPEGAKFCSACGHAVADASPAQERKLVTILFADVIGSTGLGERLDAEQLREVMDAYFASMRGAIEREGGTVEKFIGDAVMAVFGVPVAHEDDPARALRAALGMASKLEELNRSLATSHDVTLEMRVGINSGEVMAVTETRDGVGLVSGDAVNVAARLEQNADPGQILVAERVARATRGFRFAEIGPLALKGKGQPVRALRLVSEERTAERGIPGLRAPLVGRDSELSLMDSIYTRVAAEKRPHLVTVYGDPGVGKSRLVAEFLHRVEAHDPVPLVLTGRCRPYGEGVTYWPLAEILKSLAGVLDTDPSELAVQKIRKVGRELLTADVADEPMRATAALAYTVGVDDPEVAFRDLSPRQVRLEIHSAWRSFFTALASERPLVTVIEDIHWADPAMLDLLEELADRMQGPCLLLCPARPELTQQRPAWGGGKRSVSSIFLDPLTNDETSRLVAFLLEIEDLDPDVHGRILERAEGNPFFVEEIIRHLIDEGRIVHEEGRWRATPNCGDIVIPDTVQGVLAARIDLLAADEKRVAQAAAVVGRVFWIGSIRRLLGDDDIDIDIDAVLDRLEARELVAARLSSSIGGDREYIFKHILTRDVTYESLPRRDRASAHALVATWLEETSGERRREFAELLAHHFNEAYRGSELDRRLDRDEIESLRTKAFQHLVLASGSSRDRFVLDAARRLGEQALALAKDADERSAALESLGLTYQYDYLGDDAWRCLKQAVDEARESGANEDLRVIRLCAAALETPVRWPGSMAELPSEASARPYLDLALDLADRLEGDSVELVKLLTVKSFWPYGFPQEDSDEDLSQADADGRRAMEMARRLERPDLESAALDAAGSSWMTRGMYGDMLWMIDRRLELTSLLRDPWEIGDTYSMAAWTYFIIGRYSEARRLATEGWDLTSADSEGAAVHLLSWRALANYRLGAWDDTLRDVHKISEIHKDRTIPYFVLRAFAAAALVHEIRGNSAAADELMTMLGTFHVEGGLSSWAAWLAPILLRRNDIDGAIEAITEVGHGSRVKGMRAPVYETMCDAYADAERWEEARELAPELRAYAERGHFSTLPAAVDRLEGRDALASGDQERARALFERSAETFRDAGVVFEEARSMVWLAESLLSLAKHDEAREALRAADGVFEQLGAIRDREAVRELLARIG